MNQLTLSGIIASEPIHSHSTRTTVYSTFKLSVKRLSGVEDLLDVIVPSALYDESGVTPGSFVTLDGQLRSYNNKNAETNKLKINAWANILIPGDGTYDNHVELLGSICKSPIYRQTPYGREISDLMLSIPRINIGESHLRRFDYLPCIAWGSVARMCADLPARTMLRITGRFQSRQYIKLIDGIPYNRTAYEVSVSYAEPISPDADASATESKATEKTV